MKIATWNIERLKHKHDLADIVYSCEKIQADILVLTETDEQVRPNCDCCYQTPKLVEIQPDYYKSTENRVTVFTKYKCVRQHTTYDKYTALCVELETEHGNLLVYGTIIGIYGNRNPNFTADLAKQIDDIQRLSAYGDICVLGDYNLSFCDNYYFTKQGRADVLQCFAENKITLLTKDRPECIDHIAISKRFTQGADIRIEEWNYDKSLSDHKGIAVSLDFK
ncbi:MAG: endonuclease/exonuclease/phosphatase family protein [Lachnospiraceae bacterium]|nr:endonuclease/exonuclease/phosphatase family protein [Ruminococcus sp.]MCM1276413.1 endonuclease/exonuclease/phosphatase family protein [Lachnospiraceae bacterium]